MVRLPVKITPALAIADDGGVSNVVSLSRHHCSSCQQTRIAPEETLDLGLLDRRWRLFQDCSSSWDIVLEQLLVGTGNGRWRVEASITSTTVSLGDAAQLSLSARRVMMEARLGVAFGFLMLCVGVCHPLHPGCRCSELLIVWWFTSS